MAVTLLAGKNYIPKADGTPGVGYKLYAYVPSTSTPKDTYTDSGAGTPNAHPVVADARGEITVYWDGIYDVVIKDASDVTVWGPLRVATPEVAGIRADLIDSSNAANGDALIGVRRTEANAVARTLHFYVQHSKLLMANYCDPTSDTATQVATALANATTDAKAGGKALEFEPGATYTTNAEWAILGANGIRGLRFWGNGCTILRNAGAGPVVSMSAGAVLGDRCDDHELHGFVLKGNASSTYGLYTKGLLRSRLHDIRAVDIATAGILMEWGVLNDIRNFYVSDNIDTFTVNPTKGIILDVANASASHQTQANMFDNLILEGPISNVGLDLTSASVNTFKGGSFEAIPRGFVVRDPCISNIFDGIDCEANTVYDGEILGKLTTIRDCSLNSVGSSGCLLLQSTTEVCNLYGGYVKRATLDASVLGVSFHDVTFDDNGANGIQGTGPYKLYGCHKVDTSFLVTSTMSDVLGVVSSFTASETGCTTTPTGTVLYERHGDTVTLHIPSINGTSNTTACTLTGMPTSIYPSATRTDVCIVTDNSVDAFGKLDISSAGVITLGVGAAGGVFTNANGKGIRASSVTYKI